MPSCPANFKFPIGAGNTVASFQTWLNKNMRPWDAPLKVDGKCGPATWAAWQRQAAGELEDRGLPPKPIPRPRPKFPPPHPGPLPSQIIEPQPIYKQKWFMIAAAGLILLLLLRRKKR
jgi:hypothetical protein